MIKQSLPISKMTKLYKYLGTINRFLKESILRKKD